MGAIAAPYGVRGYVHIRSFSAPAERLLKLRPWYVGTADNWQAVSLASGRKHGEALVGQLEGFTDRDHAATLRGKLIAIPRSALPPPDDGQYYWADLMGLKVIAKGDVVLGQVERLMETGANDVLVVQGDRERLIPFVKGEIVKRVDLDAGCIEVDWDPDY